MMDTINSCHLLIVKFNEKRESLLLFYLQRTRRLKYLVLDTSIKLLPIHKFDKKSNTTKEMETEKFDNQWKDLTTLPEGL